MKLTIKELFKESHPLLYIVVLCGIIHEYSHYFMAKLLKIKVKVSEFYSNDGAIGGICIVRLKRKDSFKLRLIALAPIIPFIIFAMLFFISIGNFVFTVISTYFFINYAWYGRLSSSDIDQAFSKNNIKYSN